jgi:tripeptidyl-peptidase-1
LILQELLAQVSDVNHWNYGNYLTTEQIGALVAPPDERLSRVHGWLSSAGISPAQAELSLHKDFLTLTLSVKQAETLLKTEYHDYKHKSGKTLSRTSHYHVPKTLEEDIDFIGGTIRFPPSKDHGIESILQRTIGKKGDALPEGNNPLLAYILVGDKEVTINFAPRCSDGSLPTQHLGCPQGSSVTGVELDWEDLSRTFLLISGPNTPRGYHHCGLASSYHGTIHTAQLDLIQTYGLPSTTMFCSLRVSGHLENFRTILGATIKTVFPGGPSTPLELPAITPAPWVTPRRLQELYRIPTQLKNRQPSNAQSVTEFLGQYYAKKDLQIFMEHMGLPNYEVTKLLGPNVESQPGLEASLDIQYMLGISNNISTWFWSLGPLHEGQEPFLQWLIDISNTPTVPFVHSTSYADEEQSLTLDYMKRINTELIKTGVRGLTLLFSSGDDGVGGYTLRTNTSICEQRGFAPEFPSSSPYVTAVGGTQFSNRYLPVCAHSIGSLDYTCDGVGEIVSSSATGSRITSGGGFSINFEQPSFQKEAVTSYLNWMNTHGLAPPQWQWNLRGRGFPDISGMAHNYLTVIGEDVVPVDGTSASTPVTAAMLTLINDKLIELGKPRLGFFTPRLYNLGLYHPEVYTDVVVGENSCSAMRGICCKAGFHASPGWDPATGFGTPVFDILYEVITGVPPH